MKAAIFQQAIDAVTTGDEATLRALLKSAPELVHARAPFEHRPTLLHYVGANGTEIQKSPPNAANIARLLMEAGAEPDAAAPIYGPADTTMGLTVSSCVPFIAGVQVEIVDALLDFGAKINGLDDDGSPLGTALMLGYTAAAERLAARGAEIDNIVYAAGLGRTDAVRSMFGNGSGRDVPRRHDDRAGRFSFPVARAADAMEVAFVVTAMHGRLDTMIALLDYGIDVNATPYCDQTALHYAAYCGRAVVVAELLARGADKSRRDSQMGTTPMQWALELGHADIADMLTV